MHGLVDPNPEHTIMDSEVNSLAGPSSGVKSPDKVRLTSALFQQMKRQNIIRPNVVYVVSGSEEKDKPTNVHTPIRRVGVPTGMSTLLV